MTVKNVQQNNFLLSRGICYNLYLDISRASKLGLAVSLNLNSWYDSSQVMLITEAVIRLSIPHLSASSRQKCILRFHKMFFSRELV